LIIVRPVIVIVLVVYIQGLGIGRQGIYHSADGQTRHRAHRSPGRGPAPATAAAVIAPTAATTGDADITGIRHIHIFVIGVVMVPAAIMMAPVTVMAAAMVPAPGTAAVVVPKAAAAEATLMAPATMIAAKAAAAMKAAPTPAATAPTPGLGLLGEKRGAENYGYAHEHSEIYLSSLEVHD
jgi:hypothetical protein